jgi:ankyrin repeat protein
MTPLHEAAFNGHKKTYAMLLKTNGADKSIKDVLGNTCEYYNNIESRSA